MSKKSVFSNPAGKESHNRNSFPMSFTKNVNFSAGMLIPTFCKFVFGHSHVRLNQQSFFRTADVNTAAFPALPMYTDYFFVPMHQLLTMWNDFRSRTKDFHSSLMVNQPISLPNFNHESFSYLLERAGLDGSGYYSFSDGAARLSDLLGYGYNRTNVEGKSFSPFGLQNPLMACAYQKIYFDHYRNTAYEENDVLAYNLDDLISSANGGGAFISDTRLERMFKLRYANYRRDVFNTIYPSLNFVLSDNNGIGKSTLPNNLQGLLGIPAPVDSNQIVSPNAAMSQYYSGFSLDNLRASFALEKLLRVSAFTPQHVVNQFEARFGYRPQSASMHECIRLKSFVNNIIVGEVTATAETGNTGAQRLGSIGGKGVGSSQPDYALSYDTPEDGILMGISYVLPQLSYDANFADMVNCGIYPEDFSMPEYVNLGLQPVFLKNIRGVVLDDLPDGSTDADVLAANNRVLGYQPRDMQFKASVSVNHGLFLQNRALSPFTLHGKSDFPYRGMSVSSDGLSYPYFKCIPADLDSIFVTSYDGTELNDQFYGHMQFNLNIIQDKPIFGIPNL